MAYLDSSAMPAVISRSFTRPVRSVSLPKAPKVPISVPPASTMQSNSQEPSLLQKFVSYGAVIGGVEQAATGAIRIVNHAFTPTAQPNVVQEVTNASKPILQTISTTVGDAGQSVKSAAGTLIEGSKGLAGDVKSIWSWGSWGFRMLPAKMQVALGLTAAIGGFILIRSFRSGGSTHHYHHSTTIKVNGLPPQCKLVTKKDGNNTTISLDCEVETPQLTNTRAARKLRNYMLQLHWLHQRLSKANETAFLLSEPLQQQLSEMVAKLDKAKQMRYQVEDLNQYIFDAIEIDQMITEEMEINNTK